MDTVKKITEIVLRNTGMAPLVDDELFYLDSLEYTELLSAVEDALHIEFPRDQFPRTIREIATLAKECPHANAC